MYNVNTREAHISIESEMRFIFFEIKIFDTIFDFKWLAIH